MKVVLLAGGLGTRLREETEFKPKPMVTIGQYPIIWHIMKNFAQQGFKDFVVASGYKGEVLNAYFAELSKEGELKPFPKLGDFCDYSTEENWNIRVVNTGVETLTGGRLLMCIPHTAGEDFICTYGDGLSNVSVKSLIDFHKSHGAVGTVTASHPISRFGVLSITEDSLVSEFKEKQIESTWVNSGYFVFKKEICNYLNSSSPLEEEPLRKLVIDNQLYAWKHAGSWKPMDTHREKLELDAIWSDGDAFWKNWK